MPIIKVRTSRIRMVRRYICRLQEPNRDCLVLYTHFIADIAGDVVSPLAWPQLTVHRARTSAYV